MMQTQKRMVKAHWMNQGSAADNVIYNALMGRNPLKGFQPKKLNKGTVLSNQAARMALVEAIRKVYAAVVSDVSIPAQHKMLLPSGTVVAKDSAMRFEWHFGVRATPTLLATLTKELYNPQHKFNYVLAWLPLM